MSNLRSGSCSVLFTTISPVSRNSALFITYSSINSYKQLNEYYKIQKSYYFLKNFNNQIE